MEAVVPASLLELLRCPVCRTPLRVEEDLLRCREEHAFPVVRGIPRLVVEARLQAGQRQTAEAFGYSWTHYPRKNPYTEEQWGDWIRPLGPTDFEGKKVLDAGCGLGGFAEYADAWGASVVGVDLSSAIDAAHDRLGARVGLVQGDIYALPLERGSFDLAYAIGVLHHLPDPERGFRAVAGMVRPGGLVFAWVYGREHNGLIVWVVNPLRRHLFRHLPRGLLKWGVSLPLALLLWPFVRAAGAGASFPYSAYFRFLAQRDFAFTHGVVFDHLVAPTSHYVRREDFAGWFERAGLEPVEIGPRNNNSWRGLGRVPEAGAPSGSTTLRVPVGRSGHDLATRLRAGAFSVAPVLPVRALPVSFHRLLPGAGAGKHHLTRHYWAGRADWTTPRSRSRASASL